MGKISQVSPVEIDNILKIRLDSTNSLWLKRDVDDLNQESVIYFKYYFDISSAIESCLRGIVFEYSKITNCGNSITSFARQNDSAVPYFLCFDDFKSVTNGSSIFLYANNDDYNHFLSYISMYKRPITKVFGDYSFVENTYKRIRNTRNILAHGLKAMSETVEFSMTLLSDFVYIFYLIFSYYEHIYTENILLS